MKELEELLDDLNVNIAIQAKRLSIMHLEDQSATEAFDTDITYLYGLVEKRRYLRRVIKAIPDDR